MLWILEQIDTLEPEAVLSLLPAISEERRARVLSMTHEPSKVRSVLAELLLRHVLRQEHGLRSLPRLETGEKGKPFFPDRPNLQFSLSHCRTAVACALDCTSVGVDVQEVRPVRRDKHCLSAPPVFRILSEAERAWVEAGETPTEQDRRFTAVWTCKEAWGKALGVGFLYDLHSTRFLPDRETWQQHDFCFTHLSHTDFELTLCSHEPLPLKSVTFEEIVYEVTL
jgi:4'-phosphopantetheinyl transferase